MNLRDAVHGTIELHGRERATSTTALNDAGRRSLLVRPRGWHLRRERHFLDGRRGRCPASIVRLRLSTSSTTRRSPCWRRAPARTSTCRSSRATSRRGLWNDDLPVSAAAGPRGGARQRFKRDGADRDPARPPSRWTRSSTSCASTRRPQLRPLGLHLQLHQVACGTTRDAFSPTADWSR